MPEEHNCLIKTSQYIPCSKNNFSYTARWAPMYHQCTPSWGVNIDQYPNGLTKAGKHSYIITQSYYKMILENYKQILSIVSINLYFSFWFSLEQLDFYRKFWIVASAVVGYDIDW